MHALAHLYFNTGVIIISEYSRIGNHIVNFTSLNEIFSTNFEMHAWLCKLGVFFIAGDLPSDGIGPA